MITSTIKKQTSVCCSISLNPYYAEAAPEMVFQNICSFFPGATNFPVFSIYLSIYFLSFSSKRHQFSRRFYRTDMFFPGGSIFFVEQTLLSHRTRIQIFQEPLFSLRTDINFPGASIFSSNRYSFSRKPYLVLEHIQFSRRPLCLEQICIFQEGIPSRTDISLIGLGGCFRIWYFKLGITDKKSKKESNSIVILSALKITFKVAHHGWGTRKF